MTQKTRAIVINEKDNVATALKTIAERETVSLEHGGREEHISVASAIPAGHKFALCEIAPGDYVIKYGEPIGVAVARIRAGEHVHVHNIKSGKSVGG